MNEQPASKKIASKAFSRLKQERERRGWSQSDLAERIGTNQANISRWEKEITATSPGPYFRQKLSDLFAKSLAELGLFTEVVDETDGQLSVPVWNISYRRNPLFTGREECSIPGV